MSDSKSQKIEISQPIEIAQPANNTTESTSAVDTSAVQEMPTITTLLARKKFTISKKQDDAGQNIPTSISPQIQILGPSDQSVSVNPVEQSIVAEPTQIVQAVPAALSTNVIPIHKPAVAIPSQKKTSSRVAVKSPPEFKSELVLENYSLERVKKLFSQKKSSIPMRKKAVLSFLSTQFYQIGFFEFDGKTFQGSFAHGSLALTLGIKTFSLAKNSDPKLFKTLVSAFKKIIQAEHNTLFSLAGFSFEEMDQIFLFGMCAKGFPFNKKAGVWVCVSSGSLSMSDQDKKELFKLFL